MTVGVAAAPSARDRDRPDLLVVGGGINGLAIAREAARRGLSVLLADKADIGGATSQTSSRMIHGGLRYLESFDFALVRESLRERECLLRTAPHLVKPMRIVLTVFRNGTRSLPTIEMGMALYDLLSYDKSASWHRYLSRRRIEELLPGLTTENLAGGALYTDGQVPLSERLCVELAVDAARHGAEILTYVGLDRFEVESSRIVSAMLSDRIDGRRRTVHPRFVMNAAGPWVDKILPAQAAADHRLVGGTKGSHIVLAPFPGAPKYAVHFETENGKPLLCIPWRGLYLVGSTDELWSGEDPSEASISEEEFTLLLGQTQRLFPRSGITRDHVIGTYAGVRPLPYSPDKSATAITRRHHILAHGPGVANLYSIVGGKLTTHRSLAEEAVDRIGKDFDIALPPSGTAAAAFPGAISDAERPGFSTWLAGEFGLASGTVDELVSIYGLRAEAIAKNHARYPVSTPVESLRPTIETEIDFARTEEWARTEEDLIFRRLMLGVGDQTEVARAAVQVILSV
ncbi:glycerol-3-phosphate dehydrogenase [Aquamicrobium terrae]